MKVKSPDVPAGFAVRYKHHRVTDLVESPRELDAQEPYLRVSPQGGMTEAALYVAPVEKDAKPVAVGVATCHPRDSYSKSAGRAIALGRAIKTIEKAGLAGSSPPASAGATGL